MNKLDLDTIKGAYQYAKSAPSAEAMAAAAEIYASWLTTALATCHDLITKVEMAVRVAGEKDPSGKVAAHEIISKERDSLRDQLAALRSELQTRANEIMKTHACGCEVCTTTSQMCPATASSMALDILALANQLAALRSELQTRANAGDQRRE